LDGKRHPERYALNMDRLKIFLLKNQSGFDNAYAGAFSPFHDSKNIYRCKKIKNEFEYEIEKGGRFFSNGMC
jgi:hypothetical protein